MRVELVQINAHVSLTELCTIKEKQMIYSVKTASRWAAGVPLVLSAAMALSPPGTVLAATEPVLACDAQPQPLPAWAPGTNYQAGNRVTVNDRPWEALQPHTSRIGWEPPNAPSLWAGPIPCGAEPWTSGVRYVTGSLATYDQRLFRAGQGHTARPGWEPPNTPALWQLVAPDQSFTPPPDAGSAVNEGFRFIGQTYTAGVSGSLRGVSLNVLSVSSFTMRVMIQNVTNGFPNGTILREVRLARGGVALNDVIAFPNPVPQVAGRMYAIVVDYPEAPAPGAGMGQGSWQGASGNRYGSGRFTLSEDGRSWIPGDGEFDLQFRTFVTRD
jgi:hypothetical protein